MRCTWASYNRAQQRSSGGKDRKSPGRTARQGHYNEDKATEMSQQQELFTLLPTELGEFDEDTMPQCRRSVGSQVTARFTDHSMGNQTRNMVIE